MEKIFVVGKIEDGTTLQTECQNCIVLQKEIIELKKALRKYQLSSQSNPKQPSSPTEEIRQLEKSYRAMVRQLALIERENNELFEENAHLKKVNGDLHRKGLPVSNTGNKAIQIGQCSKKQSQQGHRYEETLKEERAMRVFNDVTNQQQSNQLSIPKEKNIKQRKREMDWKMKEDNQQKAMRVLNEIDKTAASDFYKAHNRKNNNRFPTNSKCTLTNDQLQQQIEHLKSQNQHLYSQNQGLLTEKQQLKSSLKGHPDFLSSNNENKVRNPLSSEQQSISIQQKKSQHQPHHQQQKLQKDHPPLKTPTNHTNPHLLTKPYDSPKLLGYLEKRNLIQQERSREIYRLKTLLSEAQDCY